MPLKSIDETDKKLIISSLAIRSGIFQKYISLSILAVKHNHKIISVIFFRLIFLKMLRMPMLAQLNAMSPLSLL
jgi:hypothetical protein